MMAVGLNVTGDAAVIVKRPRLSLDCCFDDEDGIALTKLPTPALYELLRAPMVIKSACQWDEFRSAVRPIPA
jgi:hypothetical protein